MEILFNRKEAGKLLSEKLLKYSDTETIVLAIPKGGVPVGYEIATKLDVPLGITLIKKIGHPSNKEYAIGAVSLDSFYIDNSMDIDKKYIESEVKRIQDLLHQKQKLYEGNKQPLQLKNKTVIIVDDGIATGNTILASIKLVKSKMPSKIIVAAPVVPFENVGLIKNMADEFIYLDAPKYFPSVGCFYEEFNQVKDEDVISILNQAALKMKSKKEKILF